VLAPQLLTAHDVALVFGVDSSTVLRWASSGRVPSIRNAEGRVYFDPMDLKELLSPAHQDLLPQA
jgi:predicted site-specific integrase-resolvase